MKRWIGLLGFVAMVAAVASIASVFRPGDWYRALEKPFWTPPDWLFGPVWSLLYLGIAVAGWLIFRQPAMGAARLLWALQLVLNGLWSWLFFGLQHVRFALLDITLLLVTILVLMSIIRTRVKPAFWLLAPYAVWVGYAATLNAGILILNFR